MNPERPDAYDYQVGGGLKPNAFYVWRKADEDLYEFLKQGEFCYIFNCRQMGKSSLRVKAMERIKAEGVSCGAIDLTNIGKNAVNPEKWYGGIILELHRAFKLNKQVNPKSWLAEHHHLSPLQQLPLYLEDVILAHLDTERIVIFIEEIDTVLSLNFRVDDFFALIRACYNQRAENSAYERLTFVLLGVATPSDLVQDLQQAPFNIGRAIILEGLEFEKSGILAEGLVEKAENSQQLLREILRWTGGQPFLTQKLCQIVQIQVGEVIRAGEEADKIQQLVQTYVLDNWEFQDDPEHLRTIRNRLIADEQKAGRLLGLYQQILEQGSVIADGSSEQMDLKLSGLAVKRGDRLVFYSPIYQEIFNQDWLEEELNKLRDPFYSEAITAWLASGKQDESRLLRGQALQTAQEWAKGKNLGDEDYQFLRASEQLETVAEREAKAILAEANRKAKQRIRVGSAVLIVSFILAGMATAFASYLAQQNKNLANSNQDLKQNNEQLILGNDQLNQQQETLTKRIQDKEKEIQSATKKLTEADKNRDKALKLQKQAEQQALLAKGNQFKAEAARKQAELDLAKAENDRQTAIKQIEIAQVEVKELEQKRLTIEQKLQIAEVKLRQAEQERQIALVGTKLERQGTSILQRFRAGSQGQIEILLEAMETGQELNKLVKDGRSVSDYPAISPIYSLNTILQEIREKNVIPDDEVVISPDGKYIATPSDGVIVNGWELRKTARLWDLKGNLVTEFKGHRDSIRKIVFSHDSKYLATGSADGTARLWDLEGNLVTEFKGHQNPIDNLLFSPDSKYIVTFANEEMPRLWDLEGNLVTEFKGHQNPVDNLLFSPDSKYIVTFSRFNDEAPHLWDIKGNLLAKLNLNNDPQKRRGITSIAFSPDGKYLATAFGELGRSTSKNKTARLWDLKGDLVTEFQGHQDIVNSIAFSPDSKYLATGSSDKTIRLWDLKGNLVTKFEGHQDSASNLLFSPDGKYIAAFSGYGKVATLWNIKGDLLVDITSVDELVFSPNNKYFITFSKNKAVSLWDFRGNLLNEFKTDKERLNGVFFSPDSRHIIISFKDKNARLLNLNESVGNIMTKCKYVEQNKFQELTFSPDSKYLATVLGSTAYLCNLKGRLIAELKGHQGEFSSIAFSPDSQHLATGSSDKTAQLWDLKGKLIAEFKGHQGEVNSVAFSPDGKYLATGSSDETAKLWDLKGNLIATFKDDEQVTIRDDKRVTNIAFSPDGKYLATGSGDTSVRLWDLKGNLVFKSQGFQGYQNIVIAPLIFSPDSQYLATELEDENVGLWDLTGNLVTKVKAHALFGIAFSPDSQYIATGSWDKTARLWDLKGNLIAEFKGHQGEVNSVAFSPDGKYLATSSSDKTARLWDLKGNLIAEFKGHHKYVNSVAFSPDGKYLATGLDDDTATLWKVEELPDLLARGCDWLSDYLASHPDNPQAKEVREICKNK